ncbi:MAG: hypothetical protein AB7I30_01940 [Isosphaeraceae bacterium]
MVPDYYAILEVDPASDRSTIEAALARKQPFWSSGTRNPKNKHTFQSYLDQIPAIRQALLGDPSSRAAYDAERSAVSQAQRDRKLDALQRLIRLRAAKGGLTVADRGLLRDEATRLGLTASDLDMLVASIPTRTERAAARDDDRDDPPPDVLDPVMRRQIRVALDHLGKRDLYDAIGVSRDAPAAEVILRADAERQRWLRKSQVTAEKTAWLEIVTLAQSHLNASLSRARYDRTLALEAEERFAESVAFALKGLSALDPGTTRALREEADALGLDRDRADRLIARTARTLGAVAGNGSSLTPRADFPARLLRCRSCSGLTDHDEVASATGPAPCRHCRESLRWSCPVCQRVSWVDEARCQGCGFLLADREPFLRHFEAAQRTFRARDHAASLAHLKRALEYAPNHAGARKGLERTRERLLEIERARANWELAQADRRLVAARRELDAWGELVNPTTSDWLSATAATNRGLTQARALASRGQARERIDPKAARELYRQSLAVAVDLPEAIEGLRRCPPDPPTELTADFDDGKVRLRWSPPASDGLGSLDYLIRRKAESAFQHPGEGVVIGSTPEAEFWDAGVTPGTLVSYAVVSRRDGIASVGAVAIGPIFLMAEVSDLRIETRAREVALFWNPPRGATEVRVVRKRGTPPTGPNDGDRVEAHPDHALDTNLETERVYHYGIYAIYRNAEGRVGASRGVIVSAQPHTRLPAMEPPELTPVAEGGFRIDWVEPSRGQVKLIRTEAPLPHDPGDRLNPAQVANLSGDWVEVTAPDHTFDAPPPSARWHYTPLVSWAGILTVGQTTALSTFDDPSDLRAWRVGNGRVNLRWRWGPSGDESVVAIRAGEPPSGPDDPGALVWIVTEAEYVREGLFSVTLPVEPAGPWHAAVYARSHLHDRTITSSGAEPTSKLVLAGPNQESTVTYTFRRKGWTRRRWSVLFRATPSGTRIPPTVLVTHPRAVPLSPDDGEIVARFPATREGARMDVPRGLNLSRGFARIFLDPAIPPADLAHVLLRHPDGNAARL